MPFKEKINTVDSRKNKKQEELIWTTAKDFNLMDQIEKMGSLPS